jgi:hypothetical protein
MSFFATYRGARFEFPITTHATVGELGAAVSDAFGLDFDTLKLLHARGALVPRTSPSQPLASMGEPA